MTGTAYDVAGEFAGTCRLGVMRVPTHRVSKRRSLGAQVFADGHDKWRRRAAKLYELVTGFAAMDPRVL
jgi:preprotein translocase subunit SecA